MILDRINLNQRMPVDVQEKELARLKAATLGEVLFTCYFNPNDVCETLLHMSHTPYIVNYYASERKLEYCKAE